MRKYLGLIICGLIALFLSTDKSVMWQNLSNNVFRIDIMGENDSNNIEIAPSVTDLFFKMPTWCKDCVYGRGDFQGRYKDANVKFKVTKNDTVTIMLRGEYEKQGDVKIPLFIDYSNFVVNGETILGNATSVWHDAPYKHKMNLKKGDTVEFTVRAKKSSLFKTLPYCHFSFLAFVFYFLCLYLGYVFFKRYTDSKGVNKSDFLFVILFGVLLFIPMLHISDAEKSEQEKRMLAKKPELIINDDINQKYGTQFDSWFSDRFNGRKVLINLYTSIKKNLSLYYRTNGVCVNKKTKWVGYCNGMKPNLPEKDLQHIVRNLEKLKKFTQKHNMKFYILIAPSQGAIYGDNIVPFWNSNEYEHSTQIQKYIKQNTGIDVLYPYQEILAKSKEDYVFFRTDMHWNDVGAFVGYNELMKQIKKDYKNIKIQTEDDFDYFYSNKVKVERSTSFHNGAEYQIAKLHDDSFLKQKYKYFLHKKHDKLVGDLKIDRQEDYTRGSYTFADGQYNLTLFGNSVGENLMPIIPYSFKNTLRIYTGGPVTEKLIRNLDFSRFEKQVLDHKTNVLVICLSSMDYLMYLYKD